MTQQYLELYRKAYQLADLFEYDLIVYDGVFDFIIVQALGRSSLKCALKHLIEKMLKYFYIGSLRED